MNMQAIMRQAQTLQKEMTKAKNEIDAKVFEGKSSFVKVLVNGNKKVKEVIIEKDSMDKEDMEMLQDLITVAINDAMEQIDKEAEAKLGKYTKSMPGLF